MKQLYITLIALLVSVSFFSQTPGGVSTNLHVWLKANAGVTGDPLTAWTDQSGNGYNGTATTGPTVLNNDINFNPSLSFDGVNDFVQVTNGIFGTSTFTDAWVFVINKTTNVQNSSVIWETLSGGDRFGGHLTWGNSRVYYDLGTCCGASRIFTDWGTTTGQYHLWTLGTSTSTATPTGTRKSVWRDGLTIATNNSNDSGTGNNNTFYIGSGSAGGNHAGDIAEVIIYNGTPSSADLSKIHSYLSIKYGLTLDQSTAQAYFNSAGTNIYASQAAGAHDTYDSDIAGIGRDDASALDQQKSMSINGDAKVIMDKGSAFSNDMDFAVWGNDNGSLAVSTTGAHPSYNYISQRTWRVDLTGTPGTVSVSFLLGGAWTNTGNPADYALIIDGTDSDFSTGATAHTTGASINGDTLTFTGVNFSDGDYFTFATDNIAPYPGGVVADLKIWLKANSGVTGTTNVTGWTDNGGYSNDMSTAVGPELMNAALNFNPTLSFNGSNENLVSAVSMWKTNAVTDVNIYLVAQTDRIKSNSVFREVVSGSSGRFGAHLPWTDNNLYFDAGPCCGGGNRINSNWGGTTGEDYLWTFNASTSTSTPGGNEHEILRDGGSLISDNTFSGFSGNGSNFYVGSSNGGSYFEGEIAEIAIYEGTLTQTQQRQIHTYFGVKYGIQMAHDYLASSGTTIWDATANAAYHNDVAGIGRDDDADLNQKQSISKNSDAIVTMGLGSIEVDNSTNANTFGADESFIIWGNDNGVLESNGFVDLPATVYARLGRVWKVEETGTAGAVKVQIDMSSIPGLGGVGNNDLQYVRLLVDADGTFATGSTIITPTSYDNTTDIVEFDVDFPAGSRFFTLGSVNINQAPLPVELVSFEAEIANDEVHLFWTTASEINNDRFEIQRSENGKDFETIITVQGAGNSTSIINYKEIDYSPLEGISYYRLKQVDFDGTETLSGVQVVNFYFPTEGDLTMSVFPNPATKDNINVNLDNFQDKEILIKVRDVLGKEYYSKVKVIKNKSQIVVISIDQNVPAGTYIVTASSDNYLFSKQIIITE